MSFFIVPDTVFPDHLQAFTRTSAILATLLDNFYRFRLVPSVSARQIYHESVLRT